MDYHSLPRKQLQALCKKHGIPANAANSDMADALTALLKPKPQLHAENNKQPEKRTTRRREPALSGTVSKSKDVEESSIMKLQEYNNSHKILEEDSNRKPQRVTRGRGIASAVSEAPKSAALKTEKTPANGETETNSTKQQETRKVSTRNGASKQSNTEMPTNAEVNVDSRVVSPKLDRKKEKAGGIVLRRGRVKVRSPGSLSKSPESEKIMEEVAVTRKERGVGMASSQSCLVDAKKTRKKKRSVTFSDLLEIKCASIQDPAKETMAEIQQGADSNLPKSINSACMATRVKGTRKASRSVSTDVIAAQADHQKSSKEPVAKVSKAGGLHTFDAEKTANVEISGESARKSAVRGKKILNSVGEAAAKENEDANVVDGFFKGDHVEDAPCTRRSRRLTIAPTDVKSKPDKQLATESKDHHEGLSIAPKNTKGDLPAETSRRSRRKTLAPLELNQVQCSVSSASVQMEKKVSKAEDTRSKKFTYELKGEALKSQQKHFEIETCDSIPIAVQPVTLKEALSARNMRGSRQKAWVTSTDQCITSAEEVSNEMGCQNIYSTEITTGKSEKSVGTTESEKFHSKAVLSTSFLANSEPDSLQEDRKPEIETAKTASVMPRSTRKTSKVSTEAGNINAISQEPNFSTQINRANQEGLAIVDTAVGKNIQDSEDLDVIAQAHNEQSQENLVLKNSNVPRVEDPVSSTPSNEDINHSDSTFQIVIGEGDEGQNQVSEGVISISCNEELDYDTCKIDVRSSSTTAFVDTDSIKPDAAAAIKNQEFTEDTSSATSPLCMISRHEVSTEKDHDEQESHAISPECLNLCEEDKVEIKVYGDLQKEHLQDTNEELPYDGVKGIDDRSPPNDQLRQLSPLVPSCSADPGSALPRESACKTMQRRPRSIYKSARKAKPWENRNLEETTAPHPNQESCLNSLDQVEKDAEIWGLNNHEMTCDEADSATSEDEESSAETEETLSDTEVCNFDTERLISNSEGDYSCGEDDTPSDSEKDTMFDSEDYFSEMEGELLSGEECYESEEQETSEEELSESEDDAADDFEEYEVSPVPQSVAISERFKAFCITNGLEDQQVEIVNDGVMQAEIINNQTLESNTSGCAPNVEPSDIDEKVGGQHEESLKPLSILAVTEIQENVDVLVAYNDNIAIERVQSAITCQESDSLASLFSSPPSKVQEDSIAGLAIVDPLMASPLLGSVEKSQLLDSNAFVSGKENEQIHISAFEFPCFGPYELIGAEMGDGEVSLNLNNVQEEPINLKINQNFSSGIEEDEAGDVEVKNELGNEEGSVGMASDAQNGSEDPSELLDLGERTKSELTEELMVSEVATFGSSALLAVTDKLNEKETATEQDLQILHLDDDVSVGDLPQKRNNEVALAFDTVYIPIGTTGSVISVESPKELELDMVTDDDKMHLFSSCNLLEEKELLLQNECEQDLVLSDASEQSETEAVGEEPEVIQSESNAECLVSQVMEGDTFAVDHCSTPKRSDGSGIAPVFLHEILNEVSVTMPGVESSEESKEDKETAVAHNLISEISKEQSMKQIDLTLMSVRQLRQMCKGNLMSAKKKTENETPARTPSRLWMSATKQVHQPNTSSMHPRDLPSANKRSALKSLSSNIKATPSAAMQTPTAKGPQRPRNLMSNYDGNDGTGKHLITPSPQAPMSSKRDFARSHHR